MAKSIDRKSMFRADALEMEIYMASGKKVFGVFGTGGFAREVMPFVNTYLSSRFSPIAKHEIDICFVETKPSVNNVNGYKVISEEEFCNAQCEEKLFNIAIGSSTARRDIARRLENFGCKPFSAFASTATIYDENIIGEGATLCGNTIITSNATIGKYFQANLFSYVAHDCKIGDFVTLAPRVSCNGNVRIDDFAYIGTGAVIRQGESGNPIVIGEGAVVGMGAVVTKSVPPNVTVVGNPAKEFVR